MNEKGEIVFQPKFRRLKFGHTKLRKKAFLYWQYKKAFLFFLIQENSSYSIRTINFND